MIFPYQEITPQVSRPIIPLIMKSGTTLVFYFGLIDSGADYCIFSLEVAQKLGIDLTNQEKVKFVGVGREKVKGSWGEVEVKIGEKLYKSRVIFAPISDFGHGILGQKGFFDQFDVRLSYKEQLIEIKPV